MSASRTVRGTATPAAIAATLVRCFDSGRVVPVELAPNEAIGVILVVEAGVSVGLREDHRSEHLGL